MLWSFQLFAFILLTLTRIWILLMKLHYAQYTETRLKVCWDYIYTRISKWWNFISHIKQESYKFKSKHQFVEINSTCYNIWNSYCSFKGFLSSLVHWFNLDRLIAFDMEWVPCFYVSYFLFSRNHSYRYIDPRYSIWGFGKNQEFELIFSVIDFYSLLLVDLQIPNSWN